MNRLTDVLEQRGATTLFSQHYILNDDGTRASMDETQLQADSTTITGHTAWAYDALSRLAGEVLTTSATNQSYSDAFAYDLASNRASLVHEVKVAGFTADYTASTLTFGEPKASIVVGTKLRLSVSGGNLPAGLSAGVDYYVVQPDSSGRTFKVALTPGGQPVGFTDNGSGSLQVTAQDAGGWVALLTRYTYNGDDQLTAEGADTNGDGIPDTTTAITYTYDANGSQLTSTPYGQATTTYTYDVRNKMVGYSAPSGSATYVYDDAGNRVQETTGGATTYYLTDTENPTGYAQPIEAKPSPTGTPSMTYLIGDRVLGQANGSGAVTYFLVDGHGSTRALADGTGAITKTLNYDAFGGALNFTPSTAGTVFLFGGDAVYDPVSGTYFHGNGVRQRLAFRFIEMDTFAGKNEDPLTLHKYLYVSANAISSVDPSGQSGLICTAIAVGEGLAQEAMDWGAAAMTVGAAGFVASFAVFYGTSLAMQLATPGSASWQALSDLNVAAQAGMILFGGIFVAGLVAFTFGAALKMVVDAMRAFADVCFVAGTPVLLGDGQTHQSIDEIHVGQRVATDGGMANSADGKTAAGDPNSTEVDPATWRLVTIEANDWEVQTLEPLSWIEAHGVVTGGSLLLSDVVDLAEMGVPNGLSGTVETIAACPHVESGYGRVVLTTVSHLNNFIFDLTLSDGQGNTDNLNVTGYHKFYTEDRGWVSACDLQLGEEVRGDHGDVTVTSLIAEPGVYRVYNITVETDHDYYVGDLTALVHNNCPSDPRVLRHWLESLETTASQQPGDPMAGRLSINQTRALLDTLVAQGWKIVRGPDSNWVGGLHLNLVGPGGSTMHLPVPPGFTI